MNKLFPFVRISAVVLIFTAIFCGMQNSLLQSQTSPPVRLISPIKGAGTGTPVRLIYTNAKEDYNSLIELLENRKGQVIIEVLPGTVLDNSGNGIDVCGYYIHYDTNRFSANDCVQSILIYNPKNNALDDILYRFDILIHKNVYGCSLVSTCTHL